jgi:haloacetate dehalogenase
MFEGFRLETRVDVLAAWCDWAGNVRGRAVDCGHFLAEEAPEEIATELRAFMAS